jgi:hypothetical protein
MKNQNKKSTAESTQKFLHIAEVRDDLVVLNDGTVRGVILVSSVNFDLKSEDEQKAIIGNYVNFLNSIDYPLQIVIQSRPLDIDDYLDRLKKVEREQTNELLRMQTADYREFVKELLTLERIMSKKFYVVVPYSAVNDKKRSFLSRFSSVFSAAKVVSLSRKRFDDFSDQLDKRCNFIIAGLASLGLRSQRLSTQALIELYYNSYNPDLYQRQNLEDINKLTIEK